MKHLRGKRSPGFHVRNFNDGGSPKEQPKDPAAMLLDKINTTVGEEVRKMKLDNEAVITKEVRSAMETALSGLSADQIKSISEDVPKMEASIRNIAAKLDKVIKAPNKSERKQGDELRSALDANFEKMEASLRSNRNKDQYYTLNVRAASVIDTAYTPDNTAMPTDLIDSYSIDAFVPKRRPYQYVFDFADRITVSEVARYKVWLEEGNDEGFFAVVTQGA
ncbi:hypothetical protein L0F63_006393 [Massospora cicadina]|nr:hypothetical protein L0F63_006393 [Massospora cicadina]